MSRRLYFDIETSPNVVLSFRVGRDIHLDHDNIIKERAIICICYKWENDPKVYSFTWDNKQCDRAMLRKFAKIMQQADEVVGHNGDRFDIRWFRSRCLFHGVECSPYITSIDTLKLARSGFAFNSNRLDYLGKFFGFGGKRDTGGFGLWKAITLNNDAKALASMVKYCERDVTLLQKVHERMIPYTKHRTHIGIETGGTRMDCPECGNPSCRVNKTKVSAAGGISKEMKCGKCGKYHTLPISTYNRLMKLTLRAKADAMERIERGQRINAALNENKRKP